MIPEIITLGASDGSVKQYEELLLRKNDLKKECLQLEQEYVCVFGEDMLALFHMQLECAKKVKTIELCQRYLNHGQEPDLQELQSTLQKETETLREYLKQLQEEYEVAKSAETVTEADYIQIKSIFRRLVKRLHPDTHPEVNDSEKLQDLWNQVVTAYQRNQLEDLKELEVLVASALSEAGVGIVALEIPNLKGKIVKLEAEIREIMDHDPYQYKFLLEDPETVKMKKESLKAERQNYQEYSAALDEKLAAILPAGTVIIWED